MPEANFRFLTRLHYWAADVVTHGTEAPFGEHEIDYILFIRANVKHTPNPVRAPRCPCVQLAAEPPPPL